MHAFMHEYFNQTSGSAGQKGGSLTLTAASDGVALACATGGSAIGGGWSAAGGGGSLSSDIVGIDGRVEVLERE